MSVLEMAERERTDLADFLAELTPEQWDRPTLCAGWTVRQVVAHVISYDEIGWGGTAKRLVRARLGLDAANAIGVSEDDRSPAELLAGLRAHLRPRGVPAMFGGMVALVDATIHHQDIRRPLDAPRTIPPERLRTVLKLAMLAPPVGAYRRARGLALVATDLDWRRGRGPEVRGPGEALLMALAGRPAALAELDGPGVPTLTGRM